MLEEEKKKEKIEIQVEKQQEIKQEYIGNIMPHNGHTLFEMDLETNEIKEAEFEKELTAIAFDGQQHNKRLVLKPNHIYCSALNKKNAKKHFEKGSIGDKRS